MTIVREGALKDKGMASFEDSLNKDRVEAMRQYVIFRAKQGKPADRQIASPGGN